MMDQSIYLPPSGFHYPPPPPSANPTPTFTSNPTPTYPPPPALHPPYEQMIFSAIEALKEKNGSSRQAIAKYIERVYTNLPSTHSAMLTSHLKRMRNAGVLVMDKYSYMIAGSEFSPMPNIPAGVHLPSAANVSAAAPPSPFTLTPASFPVSDQVHTAVVFDQAPDLNGPEQEKGMETVVKRGRGRPPKVRVDADGNKTAKKIVGRPREPESQTMSLPTRRGRPRKAAAESAVVVVAPSQRPSRQPKIGVAGKKYMKISGRPVGRPKMNKEPTATGPAEPKWMVDYMQVQMKLQHMQTRMQQAIEALKPHMSAENSGDLRVAAALQELEQLSTIDILAATLTDGEDHAQHQESEKVISNNQAPLPPPPQAQPDQHQYYNHGGEQ